MDTQEFNNEQFRKVDRRLNECERKIEIHDRWIDTWSKLGKFAAFLVLGGGGVVGTDFINRVTDDGPSIEEVRSELLKKDAERMRILQALEKKISEM